MFYRQFKVSHYDDKFFCIHGRESFHNPFRKTKTCAADRIREHTEAADIDSFSKVEELKQTGRLFAPAINILERAGYDVTVFPNREGRLTYGLVPTREQTPNWVITNTIERGSYELDRDVTPETGSVAKFASVLARHISDLKHHNTSLEQDAKATLDLAKALFPDQF